MKHYSYLIVGAGLYGATFARLMQNRGYDCLVIDKRDSVAGNCADEKRDGITIQLHGPHIFHTSNEKVWNFVNEFAKFKPFINTPKALSKGKLYSLPFNMHTFNELFGAYTPDEAKEIINAEIQKEFVKEPTNLEEKAINMVGRTVYETLVKEYTEKQWGKDCKELSPDIISRLPVRFTYNNNYFNDTYQGIPEDGYTKFIEKMLDGIDVLLNCDLFDPLALVDISFDKMVYCGSIDELFKYKFGKLDYRSLVFDTRKYENEDIQGVAVVNRIDKSISYTRTTEHKHFLNEKSPVTYITQEYSVKYEEGLEPYYPMSDKKNLELYEKYKTLVPDTVILGGRLGKYKYLNMDKVIEEAMKDVEKELEDMINE